MCQLVIVIVMITIYAISNSVVMITVAHVITTTLIFMVCKVDTNSCKNIMGYTVCDILHKIILTLLSLMNKFNYGISLLIRRKGIYHYNYSTTLPSQLQPVSNRSSVSTMFCLMTSDTANCRPCKPIHKPI